VCPGHVKDAFITTITNRIKVKQIGRRVLGEESGPLHLVLTPTANNMGAELPGSIGLDPLEQQSLLWASLGKGHILEPMSLVSIRFLVEGDDRPTEVLPLDRGEILGAGLVELTDLLVKFVVHSFLAGTTDTVFDVITVVPLIPGKVVEVNKQAFDSLLCRREL